MSHTYPYPMSAVGAGTILFQRTGQPNRLLVGCAARNSRVGEGYGISSGGFAEVAEILAAEVGTVAFIEHEAWREKTEELPGIGKIISQEEYLENAQYLRGLLVRVADANRVHSATYFGLEISEQERLAIEALPPSNETKRPLQFFTLTWPAGQPEKAVLEVTGKLFHRHELHAFLALAKLADRGRLWGRGT